MKILVTGSAGFIGYHLANSLCLQGHDVVGLDNINDYYDVSLKHARLKSSGFNETSSRQKTHRSVTHPNYKFIQCDLEDSLTVMNIFEQEKFEIVFNLAAQAGVRYSLTNPKAFLDSNIYGFLNILEAIRKHTVKHLFFASSSSVYGVNTEMPFKTEHTTDHPISLYAATKKSNELMAHVYSHLFNVPVTGLRFFTVYGPWGRPDMALFTFTKSIIESSPIKLYNAGNLKRDFTYVDDVVESITKLLHKLNNSDKGLKNAMLDEGEKQSNFQIYNIGNNKPVLLHDFISAIENAVGKKAIIENAPMQPGDVFETWADTKSLVDFIEYQPNTPLQIGINQFVNWYKNYYSV